MMKDDLGGLDSLRQTQFDERGGENAIGVDKNFRDEHRFRIVIYSGTAAQSIQSAGREARRECCITAVFGKRWIERRRSIESSSSSFSSSSSSQSQRCRRGALEQGRGSCRRSDGDEEEERRRVVRGKHPRARGERKVCAGLKLPRVYIFSIEV